MILNEEDIITTDSYLNFCIKNNICYIKTDYFYIGQFNWRGNLHPIKIDNKIVIGHSDYEINDEIAKKYDLIFCINKNTLNPNVYGIPLGITNYCDDSPLHKIYGDKKIMINISREKIEKENLLFINFNTSTHNSRKNLYNKFSNYNWVKTSNIENSIEGREKYLRNIKSSKFVLCPRGNGIDTHRLWETLYMGSIPIVKYENAHELFTDLPILFINDWNEINENFLNEKYIEINNKKWNLEKLKISYWTNFIKEKIVL